MGATEEGRQGRRAFRLTSRATEFVADVVHPDVIVDHVDIDAVVQRIDIETVVERIDIDGLVQRIDIDALVRRIDMDALVQRIDIEALVGRIDMNALLDRVDIDRIMDQVDVKEIVDRAGIADIVRESTGALTGSVVDVARRQMAALDEITGRIAYRLTGRDPTKRPAAPSALVGIEEGVGIDEEGRGQITGHYAGPVTRLAAFALDLLVVFGVFTLFTAGARLLADTFGWTWTSSRNTGIVGVVLMFLCGWWYYALSLVVAGRTLGMAAVGLRVVTREGLPLHARHAVWRTVVLPLSVLPFCLGCVGILLNAERRALHDRAGRTVVVHDWGDRPAELPAPLTDWIERRATT